MLTGWDPSSVWPLRKLSTFWCALGSKIDFLFCKSKITLRNFPKDNLSHCMTAITRFTPWSCSLPAACTYCHCCVEPQVLQAKVWVEGEGQNVLTPQSFKSIRGRLIGVHMTCSEPETPVACREGGFILPELSEMTQASTKDKGLWRSPSGNCGDLSFWGVSEVASSLRLWGRPNDVPGLSHTRVHGVCWGKLPNAYIEVWLSIVLADTSLHRLHHCWVRDELGS